MSTRTQRVWTGARANWHFVRVLVMTNLKAAAAQRGKFWVQVTFMILNNLTWFVFWWVLLGRMKSLRGVQVDDVMLLVGVCACAFVWICRG